MSIIGAPWCLGGKIHMRCFHCPIIPEAGELVELENREDKHVFTTLRGGEGNLLKLIDGNGCVAEAKIEDGKKIRILKKEVFPPLKPRLALYVCPPHQQQKMDLILAQCAELGVSSLVPIISERSVSKPDKIPDRWKLHIVEGCKQSQNPFFTEIRPVKKIADAIAQLAARKDASVFFGSLNGASGVQLKSTEMKDEAAWIVGPEGGFTAHEEELMKAGGFIPLRIGKWTMRTETAAVAGAAMIMNSLKT